MAAIVRLWAPTSTASAFPQRIREFHAPGGRVVNPPDLRGYVEIALRGGFPELALELYGVARREWLGSCIEQLMVHERAASGSAPDPSRLGTYFAAYAINSAGVVDATTLATAAGIDRRTG